MSRRGSSRRHGPRPVSRYGASGLRRGDAAGRAWKSPGRRRRLGRMSSSQRHDGAVEVLGGLHVEVADDPAVDGCVAQRGHVGASQVADLAGRGSRAGGARCRRPPAAHADARPRSPGHRPGRPGRSRCRTGDRTAAPPPSSSPPPRRRTGAPPRHPLDRARLLGTHLPGDIGGDQQQADQGLPVALQCGGDSGRQCLDQAGDHRGPVVSRGSERILGLAAAVHA